MTRIKYEFDVKNHHPQKFTKYEELKTLEEASKFCVYKNQCTYEDARAAVGYSHIIEYRDNGEGFEHYNDLYFI